MKTRTPIHYLLLVLAAMLALSFSGAPPHRYLVQSTEEVNAAFNDKTTWTYAYDSRGRIASATMLFQADKKKKTYPPNSRKDYRYEEQYTYSGDSLTISMWTGGALEHWYHYTLSARGLISAMEGKGTYTYDSAGYLTDILADGIHSTSKTIIDGDAATMTYSWMYEGKLSSGQMTWQYYPQPELRDYGKGYLGAINKHLVRSSTCITATDTIVIGYSYTYDKPGRVKTETRETHTAQIPLPASATTFFTYYD